MKSTKRKNVSILVVLVMVLTLFPADLVLAAAKTTLNTKNVTLEVGKTATIALNNKAKTSKYLFTSSNKSVASVSSTGVIKAVNGGAAKITVKEVNSAKKSSTVGTVSVKVTAAATTAPEKAGANSYMLNLSAIKGTGASYNKGSKTATIKGSTASIPLQTPLNNGETITITIKGKYNGSKGFRSFLTDKNDETMSDIAGTDVMPSKAGEFTITYQLTATDTASMLYFKGPSFQDSNVDNVTFTSIEISQFILKY